MNWPPTAYLYRNNINEAETTANNGLQLSNLSNETRQLLENNLEAIQKITDNNSNKNI